MNLSEIKTKKMYKYIEIIEDKTNEVVSRIDITNQSDMNLEKIMTGINRNLNHNEFSITEEESKNELPILKKYDDEKEANHS